jgi:hypothetical protein
MASAGELREVVGGLVGFEWTGSTANGPASTGVGLSFGTNCGWSPMVFHLAFTVQIRSRFRIIEFFSANGIMSFCLTSETLAGNGRKIITQMHGVGG